MSVIMLDNPSGYGRVIIENNSVLEIVEQKDCDQSQLCTKSVNAGVYCVSSKLLNRYIPKLSNENSQKEYYLTDIIKMGVEENITIEPIYVDEEEFKGVNSKIDLAHAEQIHQNRIKNNFMANGVIMRLPDTIYIESDVEIEGECTIENGVSLIGLTKIIDSHIKSNSVVEDSTLRDSDVGPMARIRPQSILSGTHIGNFVEVKKGILDGVKAGHLSYLGDCTIGNGSNIGAGTITCNYDGKAKYQTIIGKNVFVGSDTQLIAPVTIPDDVMIAAGTTVTKDPISGDLVLSRTPQKSIAGFFYKFFNK
jgi:bifunctional UDP-N-acetylglucosamine pyrophosphorylase/glucosamine-1-phosphate N-acetyltransferase